MAITMLRRFDQIVPGLAFTFGVEEEFLLVDANDGRITCRAKEILSRIPTQLVPYIKPELLTSMIEVSSPVSSDLTAARSWLLSARRTLSDIAARLGIILISAGNAVRDTLTPPTLTDDPRFVVMHEVYGPLVEVQGLCACHVHVGVDDPELVIEACNRVRPWLPVLHSLTVNSPFADDLDTGYASWRSILWTRWPTAGPSPILKSPTHQQNIIDSLIESGAMLDERMVYWYARPSSRYPTLEIRIGDACATVDEAILAAGLSRALVATVLAEHFAGEPRFDPDHRTLQLAHWRAAHQGVDGSQLDPVTGLVYPGWEMVDRLVEHVTPALIARGDLELITGLIAQLRARGSAATRQRAAYAVRGKPIDVIRHLAAETVQG